VVGRESDKIWPVKASLYSVTEFNIEVHNKFLNAEYGDFEIKIEMIPLGGKKKSLKKSPSKKKGEVSEEVVAVADDEEVFPAFFCKTPRINKLKKNNTVKLPIIFIPLIME